ARSPSAQHRERVHGLNDLEPRVLENHLAGETDTTGVFNGVSRCGPAVMQGDNPVGYHPSAPTFPVVLQALIPMVGVNKDEIDPTEAAQQGIPGRLDPCLPDPLDLAVGDLAYLKSCDHPVITEPRPAGYERVYGQKHAI